MEWWRQSAALAVSSSNPALPNSLPSNSTPSDPMSSDLERASPEPPERPAVTPIPASPVSAVVWTPGALLPRDASALSRSDPRAPCCRRGRRPRHRCVVNARRRAVLLPVRRKPVGAVHQSDLVATSPRRADRGKTASRNGAFGTVPMTSPIPQQTRSTSQLASQLPAARLAAKCETAACIAGRQRGVCAPFEPASSARMLLQKILLQMRALFGINPAFVPPSSRPSIAQALTDQTPQVLSSLCHRLTPIAGVWFPSRRPPNFFCTTRED